MPLLLVKFRHQHTRVLCAGFKWEEEIGTWWGTPLSRGSQTVLGVAAEHAAGGAPGVRREALGRWAAVTRPSCPEVHLAGCLGRYCTY